MKHSNNIRLALAALMGAAAIGFASCEDQPDEYKSTSGSPEVQYIRLPESADSVVTKSYLQTTVCLVGNNLRSIRKLLFNDQEALLNTSYITDNTLLVDIPKNIPAAVTDKIYMINEAGDTTTYDFHVIVPPPVVSAMNCEYAAAGDEVTLTGDYFIQDPYKPLKVKFNDGTLPVTDIRSISKNSITFTVPAGAQSGRVCVESVYGESRSQFVYKDNRNILFDFDGSHGGLAGGHGWRPGRIRTGGIDGSYLYLGGAAMLGKVGATWDEDDFAMNYWPEPSAGFPELTAIPSFANMLDTCDIDDLALKFECRVPETSPWSASALQLIFTGNLYAAGGSQGGGFTYVAEGLTGAFRAIAPSITGHADFEEGMRIVNWPRANFLAAKEKLGMTDDEMNTFNAYFDVMNFASRVTCPVISCFSLQDTTDPVRTNLAPFNLLDKVKEGDKVYIINPFLGHATPAGWGKWYMEFFEKHHSDRTPAAIRQTTSSTAGDTCAVCFDMTGRRVSVPGRGLYITGGRKLVMR